MQNWKIKRMSYKELTAQLKAVLSLLYYYQKGSDYPDNCLLCTVPEKHHERALRSGSTCDFCLWQIIENEDCGDFADRKFNVSSAAWLTGKKKWHKVRIPMLRRWKKILKAELARREQ